MIYLFIIIILLFLAYYYDFKACTKYKDTWYTIVLIIIISLVGFRYRLGIDTTNYLYHFYHTYPPVGKLSWKDISFGLDPAFVFLNSIIKELGGRYYMVQLVQATFINVLIFKYIKKHSSYIFTCVLFYFIWKFYTLNMEEVRAAMAIVICLYANDFFVERRYFKGFLLGALATMFHFSALVIILTPLLRFVKWNKWGIILLIIFFAGGILLQSSLQDYLLLFEYNEKLEGKAEAYSKATNYINGGLNIYGHLAYLSQCIYAIWALIFIKRVNQKANILNIEPLFMIGLFLFAISINVPIIIRLFNFYCIYIVIYTAEFCKLLLNTKKIGRGLATARLLIILFPYFFFIGYGYTDSETYPRFLPYSSVFDMTVDPIREQLFNYSASPNEY